MIKIMRRLRDKKDRNLIVNFEKVEKVHDKCMIY